MSINSVELRKTLGQFATGVTVVATTQEDGTPRGFTANSFTSVSLNPPLILVCISEDNESKNLFCKSKFFTVSVLNEKQKETSNLFASNSSKKFKLSTWHIGNLDIPLIEDSLAWFECQNHKTIVAGDHIILIGKVLHYGRNDGFPLGYFQGNYISLGNNQTLVDTITKKTKTIIGIIFDNNNSILFEKNKKTGDLTLPSISNKGEKTNISNLLEKFEVFGFKSEVDFIYSVYEDKNLKAVCVYYRSKVINPAPKGYSYISFSKIPFN